MIKILVWMLVMLIVLIGGGVFGFRAYHRWQERRLFAQANALVNEGDLKRAGLDARRILQINPESVDGCRIMARIAERTSSPAEVDWRRRVVDLKPDSAADLIALAKAALQFDDAANRDYALKRLPESAKTSAAYHALAADLAGKREDGAEMEKHLREAVRLEPTNKEYLMKLATLQVNSRNAAVRQEGQQTLVQLQADPAMRREALRSLTESALRRQDYDAAMASARALQELPDRAFSDRLLLLTAVHGAIDSGFTPLVQEVETEAGQNPDDVAELISWLNAQQMPAAAISWSSQLPAEIMTKRAVPIALADSFIAARDWTAMQAVLKKSNWGGLNFLRDALSARAYRELGDQTQSSAAWAEAVNKVGNDSKQAITLAEIVLKWGWRDEAIELFWVASKDPTKGDDALQALYSYFAKTGASQDLYRVLVHRRDFHPDDLNIQNNVAQLSLLLNLNTEEGRRLARDLYEKEPKNAAYVSTYAFALYTQGDVKKALKLFGELTDEQLHQPEIAAYYGVILAASSESARAPEFLTIGETAQLLPEERALLEKARRTLARS